MAFELTGTLHKVFDSESKTATFQAREFVVSTEGAYPQYVKFQLTQDRCELISSFEEGKPIKVHFDLRGREWQGKYFTNLNAWKLESVEAESAAEPAPVEMSGGDMPPMGSFPKAGDAPAENPDLDDLPF